MTDTQDKDNDSDLEILPNPEPTRNVLDLSMNNDTVQSVIDDMYNEQQNRQQYCKKRTIISIKQEEAIHKPRAKKRKVNNNDHKPIISVKQEKKQKKIVLKKNMKKYKKRKHKNKPNNFNRLRSGINYCGKCSNNDCVAFNKDITMKCGYGIFEPNKESKQCPVCSKPFKLKYIYLYETVVIIRSRKYGETIIKQETMSIKGDDYVKYDYKIKEIIRKIRNNRNRNVPTHSNSCASQTMKSSQNRTSFLELNVQRHIKLGKEKEELHKENIILREQNLKLKEKVNKLIELNENSNNMKPMRNIGNNEMTEENNSEDNDIIVTNDNINDGIVRILEDNININWCPKCGIKVTRTDEDIENKCSVMTCREKGCNDGNNYTYWCWDCRNIIDSNKLSFNKYTSEPAGACQNCRKKSRIRRNKCKLIDYRE